MPEPTPETTAGGFLGHAEKWFEEHVLPEVGKLREEVAVLRQQAAAAAARADAYAQAHAPLLLATANNVLAVVEAADPAAAPAVAALKTAAEKAVADAEAFLERVSHGAEAGTHSA